MDENTMKQLFAELIESQGEALGLVVAALCTQVDPARLTADLRKTLAAAQMLPSANGLAIRIAGHALEAAEAAKMLQAKPASEGPYPKRG